MFFLFFRFRFSFSLISPCNQNRECERERTQIEHFIELLKLEATDKQNHANKTYIHTYTQSRTCSHTRVGGFYFRQEKKEENRNYFVVKDVIVNVYKVKTEIKPHKIMCKTKDANKVKVQ